MRQLTRNRGRHDLNDQWSPDGKSIAFASDRARPGEHEIFVMRANGTGARRLVRTINHAGRQDTQFSPVWSPDGRRILFSMTVSADWSRDGRTVVFVSNREGRSSDLWAMNANGARQHPIVRRPNSDDWRTRATPRTEARSRSRS